MGYLKFLLEMPFSARQHRLASSRQPMSEDDFIMGVASTDLGRVAAASLWRKLQEVKVRTDFSPYPDDDLLFVFGLAEEDLDEDIIMDVIEELHLPLPSHEFVESFGPVRTPLDIIRLVETCGTG